MSPREPENSKLLAVLAMVGLGTFLFSVLVAGQILLWFLIVLVLVVVYLGWRFVRAAERIAAAMEG